MKYKRVKGYPFGSGRFQCCVNDDTGMVYLYPSCCKMLEDFNEEVELKESYAMLIDELKHELVADRYDYFGTSNVGYFLFKSYGGKEFTLAVPASWSVSVVIAYIDGVYDVEIGRGFDTGGLEIMESGCRDREDMMKWDGFISCHDVAVCCNDVTYRIVIPNGVSFNKVYQVCSTFKVDNGFISVMPLVGSLEAVMDSYDAMMENDGCVGSTIVLRDLRGYLCVARVKTSRGSIIVATNERNCDFAAVASAVIEAPEFVFKDKKIVSGIDVEGINDCGKLLITETLFDNGSIFCGMEAGEVLKND